MEIEIRECGDLKMVESLYDAITHVNTKSYTSISIHSVF